MHFRTRKGGGKQHRGDSGDRGIFPAGHSVTLLVSGAGDQVRVRAAVVESRTHEPLFSMALAAASHEVAGRR